jgi:mRNA interferase MazF
VSPLSFLSSISLGEAGGGSIVIPVYLSPESSIFVKSNLSFLYLNLITPLIIVCMIISMKNYSTWMKRKSDIENKKSTLYTHVREIWWCSIGLNVGAEIDGKNENFERPVIILKVYNKETLLVLPLTTKQNDNLFHFKIETKEKIGWAKLTQARVISSKRLLRRVDIIPKLVFYKLMRKWKDSV